MKKFAGILLVLVGACAAAAYWIDLVQFTDPAKGFSTVGSLWLRYLLVAALLLLVLPASQMAAKRPAAMERRNLPLAGLLLLCGVVCIVVGTAQTVVCAMGALTLKKLLLGVFGMVCGWWMLALCAHWGSSRRGVPAGGVAFGAMGSLFFMVLTLARFACNYSSVYRFAQTMQTFDALAALLLSAVVLRVGFFPESAWGRRVYITGMWAFYLCTCCEVPQAVARYRWGQTTLGELGFSILLGFIGLLGAGCALSSLSEETENTADM